MLKAGTLKNPRQSQAHLMWLRALEHAQNPPGDIKQKAIKTPNLEVVPAWSGMINGEPYHGPVMLEKDDDGEVTAVHPLM